MESTGKDPRVNGFALIMTNDYSDCEELQTLTGTKTDGEHMKAAFQSLNFETHWERNLTERRMRDLIHFCAARRYLHNYRRIAVVFSGHGTKNHSIYAQDGKPMDVDDILRAFYPETSPNIGALPKLFFIDACRGCEQTKSVLVSKGVRDISLHVPEKGNFLVAYSTMPDHQSYEQAGKGGLWMELLAEKLKSEDASVLDVLTKVNQELCAKYCSKDLTLVQQPELISRLNEEIHLLSEAMEPKESVVIQDHNHSLVRVATKNSSSKPHSVANSVPHYALCKNAKEILSFYCKREEKPPPTYEHRKANGSHIARVYVAKTFGWICSDSKLTKAEAEEDAAAKLIKKLHLH